MTLCIGLQADVAISYRDCPADVLVRQRGSFARAALSLPLASHDAAGSGRSHGTDIDGTTVE